MAVQTLLQAIEAAHMQWVVHRVDDYPPPPDTTFAEHMAGLIEGGHFAEQGLPGVVEKHTTWCPTHGTALCPEDYMLDYNAKPLHTYRQLWREDMFCGLKQPLYRIPPDATKDPTT